MGFISDTKVDSYFVSVKPNRQELFFYRQNEGLLVRRFFEIGSSPKVGDCAKKEGVFRVVMNFSYTALKNDIFRVGYGTNITNALNPFGNLWN